jgi:hypothetical protein
MRHLNGVYTQRFNKRRCCDGQLFMGRYKSILVESDSYALELVRNIHRNPLEAGLVDNLQKYPWSTTPEEINQIFGRRNLPAILGSKSFVDRIKDKFFNLTNFEEIPRTQRLAPDIDKIKYAVCKAYNIKENQLYVTTRGYFNEPRNVAVYMIRHLRNDTLKQVGEQFGIEKYSTVSSIVERVKYEMKVDNGLKKRVQNLAEKITKSQRQT